MIRKNCILRLAGITLLGLGITTTASAQDAVLDEVRLLCHLDGQIIFQSSESDIAGFDADGRGYTLYGTNDDIEAGVTYYTYTPGPVICVSSANPIN